RYHCPFDQNPFMVQWLRILLKVANCSVVRPWALLALCELQVFLDNVRHAQSRRPRASLRRRVTPFRNPRGMVPCRLPRRLKTNARRIPKHNAARALVLVTVLVDPRPATRRQRAQAEPVAGAVPKERLRLAGRANHLRDVRLREASRRCRLADRSARHLPGWQW